MSRFKGRRAIVTGGASGIGEAMVSRLLMEGASVASFDVAPTANRPSSQASALALQVDVRDPEAMETAIRAVDHELDGVDLLFNNAGIGSVTSVIDATVEEWNNVFAVNTFGTFLA